MSRNMAAAVILALVLATPLGVAGCHRAMAPVPGGQSEPPGGSPVTEAPSGTPSVPSSFLTPTSAAVPLMGDSGLPFYYEKVMAVYDGLQTLRAASWVIVADKTYILASLGHQTKAGAKIQFADLDWSADAARVTLEITPAGEAEAAEPYTPMVVRAVPGQLDAVAFAEINGREFPYVPAELVRAPVAWSDYIQVTAFGQDSRQLVIAGIARVYEGTVEWELRDSLGKPVGHGFTTAESGDWSPFEIRMDGVPKDAVEITVFSTDMSDGTRDFAVSLTLPQAEPAPSYPESVTHFVEGLRLTDLGPVGAALPVGDDLYVLASAGRQENLGAGVHFAGVNIEGDSAVIRVALTGPSKAKAVAPYTPVAVTVLHGVKAVSFQNRAGTMGYFPAVIGLQGPLTPVAQSRDIVVTGFDFQPPAGAARIRGLARVFEAQFAWELVDADGKAVGQGQAHSVVSAPEWGFFDLTVPGVPASAAKLILYDIDGKGDRCDELALDLRK